MQTWSCGRLGRGRREGGGGVETWVVRKKGTGIIGELQELISKGWGPHGNTRPHFWESGWRPLDGVSFVLVLSLGAAVGPSPSPGLIFRHPGWWPRPRTGQLWSQSHFWVLLKDNIKGNKKTKQPTDFPYSQISPGPCWSLFVPAQAFVYPSSSWMQRAGERLVFRTR